MYISVHPSKKVSYFAILGFFLFLANTSFSGIPTGPQQKPDALIKEGIELYNSGQYEKAINTLTQVEGLNPSNRLLSEAFFYLSLCYFQLGDKENTKQFILKTLKVEPNKMIDETKYAPEYNDLFKQAQGEVTVVTGREARPGGGIKIGRIALIGAAVVGVAAAAYFLFLRPDTGSIQVNSTPTGALVYRDGTDTGWKTNCTLSEISPGDHIIKLVKDGYTDYEQKVTVKRGNTAMINATLPAIPIRVTKPAGGSTWVKGQIGEIKWETGTSSSLQFLQRASQFTDPANASSYLRRTSAFQVRSTLDGERGKRGTDSEDSRSSSALASSQGIRSLEGKDENPVSSSASQDRGRLGVSLKSQDIGAQSLYDRFISSQPSSAFKSTQQGEPLGRMDTTQKTNLLDIAKVKIELYKGADMIETVESSTENDGNQNWTVPTTLADGTDYKIRVSCTSDLKIYGESGNFSITAANIVITQPTSTTSWGQGETREIKWTSTVSGSVKIDLLKGTTPYVPIVDNTPNNGSFKWTISPDLEQRMDYGIRITLLSDPSLKGESPAFIIAKLTFDIDAVTTGFTTPVGITIDHAGNAHVAEGDSNDVVKFIPASGAVSPIIHYGGALNQPRGIVADTMGGFIFVVDSGNHRIQKFDTNGTFIATIGTLGSNNGEFNAPHGIAIDKYFNVYVTDRNNARVQKFSLDLTWIQSWSVSGDPRGIACDSSRNSVYVADYAGKQILVYSLDGAYYRSWSVVGRPIGIAVDKSGFVYVTDVENHRFLKYTPEGVLLCQKGSYGDAYDQFKTPADLCFDSLGRLLVTSWENNRVQIFK
jgi:DNA-binding beta-propeller fold protein YncE